jgi:hypothetical protein
MILGDFQQTEKQVQWMVSEMDPNAFSSIFGG